MSAFIRPTLLRFFSPTQVLRKAAPGEQLGLFGTERKPVRRPGSRGGKYWVTQRGDIRYGERPVPGTPAYEALPGRPKAAPLVLPRPLPHGHGSFRDTFTGADISSARPPARARTALAPPSGG